MMFDEIANNYDLANSVMTLGINKIWRKNAIKIALKMQPDPIKVLDVACGSGDMMLLWKEALQNKVSIFGIDPSLKMLDIAQKKLDNKSDFEQTKEALAKENSDFGVFFTNGFAQELGFIKEKSINIISIAFGLRNVVDLDSAICEFSRILKDDGILVILEFMKRDQRGFPKKGFLDGFLNFYVTKILPLVGGIVSRNYKAYKYLPNSIDGFLTTKELGQKLSKNGLKIEVTKTYAKVATLIIARK